MPMVNATVGCHLITELITRLDRDWSHRLADLGGVLPRAMQEAREGGRDIIDQAVNCTRRSGGIPY